MILGNSISYLLKMDSTLQDAELKTKALGFPPSSSRSG